MLLLSVDGWVNGLTAGFSFLLGTILGLTVIYQARKVKARLLLLMGINIFLTGFFWLANFIDLITVLITNNNIPNPNGWFGIFYLMWSPLVFLFSLYIGAEILTPKKKKFFILIFLVLGIIYELYIFINPMDSFTFIYPLPGEGLIDTEFTPFRLPFILNYFFLLSALIFCGFGYLIKAVRSEGIIRKKFLQLSLGYILFIGFPFFVFFVEGIYTYFIRLGMVSGFFFFYFGLKEAPIDKQKKKSIKKELKVRESLFRLYERPEYLSEEEVSFHKEKKICLVCKGRVSRLSYICPKCNALYCEKCTAELSDLENMCWVCQEPIDESKPTKPYKFKLGKDFGKKKK
ncbi:MAG: hypothetical protein ACFE8N_11040 [Promethearchaeota archaeon]